MINTSKEEREQQEIPGERSQIFFQTLTKVQNLQMFRVVSLQPQQLIQERQWSVWNINREDPEQDHEETYILQVTAAAKGLILFWWWSCQSQDECKWKPFKNKSTDKTHWVL